MPQLISTLLLLLGSSCLYTQVTLEREVIGSLGTSFSSPALQLSATAGEAVITTLSSPTLLLTQGFQQAEPEELTATYSVPEFLSQLTVYPNPARDRFRIEMIAPFTSDLNVQLLDATGRRISMQTHRASATAEDGIDIDAANWPAGLYLVRIVTDTGLLAGSARVVVARH